MELTVSKINDRHIQVRSLSVRKFWEWLQSGELLPLSEVEPQPDLVETFLISIPCPPALLHEDQDGNFTSVKNPTLESVLAFIRGDFWTRYEGKIYAYADLPPNIRRYLMDLQVQTVITYPTCSQEVREEVEVRMGRRSK
jgi:hypothetical protein